MYRELYDANHRDLLQSRFVARKSSPQHTPGINAHQGQAQLQRRRFRRTRANKSRKREQIGGIDVFLDARGTNFDISELLQSSGHHMSQPKRVLLTNDDGPDSTFFQAWVKHVQDSLQ